MDCTGQLLHERYRVAELLGEGTEALVYRADDLRLDRQVAIKLLRPELRADPSFVTRFEREARGAARLAHPHIVRIYDYGEIADGEAEGTYFLVMEYVEGGDLRDRLQPGVPLPVPSALRLAREVAEALADAHAHAIVHRDVKPANILLTEHGQAKVTDFGIAKMLDVPALTASAALLGTPHYLSPEQAGAGAITPASDVYALGVVLFEMLAGRRPFEDESFVQVAMQHLHAEPPALEALNPAVPPELAVLVQRAMAKDPGARFPDGNALSAALAEEERKLVAAEPTAARAAGASASALPAAVERPRRGVREAAASGRRIATLWFMGDTLNGRNPKGVGEGPLLDPARQSTATGQPRAALPTPLSLVQRASPEHTRALLMGLPIVLGLLTALLVGPLLFGGSGAGDSITGAALSASEIADARLPAGAGELKPPPTKTPAAAAATVSPAGAPTEAPPSAGAAEPPPTSPPTAAVVATAAVRQQSAPRSSPTARDEATPAPAATAAPPTAAAPSVATPTEPPTAAPPSPAAAPPPGASPDAAVVAQPAGGATGPQTAPATAAPPAAPRGATPVEVANGVSSQAGPRDTLSVNPALAPTMAAIPTAVPTAAPTAAPPVPPTAVPPVPPTAAAPAAPPSATTGAAGGTSTGQAPAAAPAAPVQPTSAPTAAPARRGGRQGAAPGQPAVAPQPVPPGARGPAPMLGDPMRSGSAPPQAAPVQPWPR